MTSFKLPRGSGYTIKIGHRFYAGEDREFKEVELKEAYEPRERGKIYYSQGQANGPAMVRARRKGKLADYLKSAYDRSKDKPKEPAYRRELTGKTYPRLVDEQSDAKLFRTKKAVDSTCERLKRLYSSLDVKISVQLIDGGTK